MRPAILLIWQKDEDGNQKPQMKRDRYGGADWVETQKAVLQDMMLREFVWERFYKGSNPRGNLLLSDYRKEKAAEMAKEEERKLEDIKDKVVTRQATIQAQAEQMFRWIIMRRNVPSVASVSERRTGKSLIP